MTWWAVVSDALVGAATLVLLAAAAVVPSLFVGLVAYLVGRAMGAEDQVARKRASIVTLVVLAFVLGSIVLVAVGHTFAWLVLT